MCHLCLQDFTFELPVKPELERKKERLLRIKSLLALVVWASEVKEYMGIAEENDFDFCENKIEALKEEQYKLSREF